jgi:hypothetical protein
MKQHYRSDFLRTLPAEDNNITALWKEMTVCDNDIGVPWAWSSMNPVMLVLFQRKPVPNLDDDDLQGFPNKETSKSEILVMVCTMRGFKNVDTDNVELWLQTDAYELSFQDMTNRHGQCCQKQKGKEKGEQNDDEICCSEELKEFTKTSDYYKLLLKINASCIKK